MERLHEDFPSPLGFVNELPGFSDIGGERLFEENMFPRIKSFVGPFIVQRVWGGNVDEIDLWVGEKLLVRAVRLLKVIFGSLRLRGSTISGGDCIEDDVGMGFHRVNDWS